MVLRALSLLHPEQTVLIDCEELAVAMLLSPTAAANHAINLWHADGVILDRRTLLSKLKQSRQQIKAIRRALDESGFQTRLQSLEQ